MSLKASTAQQELLERHYRAIELLQRKLSILPKRHFSLGKYPTITDFYENHGAMQLLGVTPDYGVLFVLEQGGGLPNYLSEELFECPHVQLLLRDIDEGVVSASRLRYDEKDMWMSPYAAINLLSGQDFRIDKLGQLFEVFAYQKEERVRKEQEQRELATIINGVDYMNFDIDEQVFDLNTFN
ncbi:hypothetical protein E8E11_000576 [Didymella keratinophila]|nr:hypothetical protein E8E11_000576 [Didymella keratinophila]